MVKCSIRDKGIVRYTRTLVGRVLYCISLLYVAVCAQHADRPVTASLCFCEARCMQGHKGRRTQGQADTRAGGHKGRRTTWPSQELSQHRRWATLCGFVGVANVKYVRRCRKDGQGPGRGVGEGAESEQLFCTASRLGSK
jgi:hypothetical protein